VRALRVKLAVGIAVLGAAGVATVAVAGDRGDLRTDLTGYEEVPAVSTEGDGSFQARIARDAEEIEYELSYGGLNGPVLQAHIHLAQEDVNGGISVFLCTNLDNAPGVQACPQEGTVTGTIRPADVIGPEEQGIAPGEFAELVRAIRAGVAYVNVHSEPQPGGEIRGQIGDEDDDPDDDDRSGEDGDSSDGT
jgi:CHRD domain